jgi:hypothetical protein
MGFNRRKLEDQRRDTAEKEAATRRATDAQVLEDAERLIAARSERQAKANADTVLARCRFGVVGHSYTAPAQSFSWKPWRRNKCHQLAFRRSNLNSWTTW